MGKGNGEGGEKGEGKQDGPNISMKQKAYTQTIAKENAIMRNHTKNEIARLEPLFSVNNSYFGLFKKDDINNSHIKIGHSFEQVDVSKVDPSIHKPKRSVAKVVNQNPLPFEREFLNDNKPVQKDHHTFNREAMRNQPLSKEALRVPIRSSEEYGWHEPIDPFNNLGNGLKSQDGGVMFHQLNKGANRLSKRPDDAK